MKKMALIAAFAVASLSARAAFLDWKFDGTSSDVGRTVYLVTEIGDWENESQLASAALDSASVVKITSRSWGTKAQHAELDPTTTDVTDMYAVMIDPTDSGKYIAKSLGNLSSFVYDPANQESSPGTFNTVTVNDILTTGTKSPWYQPQPVPEPTSVALLAIGLAALGLKRKVA